LWDTRTGKPIGQGLTNLPITNAVTAIFSPDGRALVVRDDNTTVFLCAITPGQPRIRRLGHLDDFAPIKGFAAPSPDGRVVLVGDQDGIVQLWDAVTQEPIGPPRRHARPIHGLFSGLSPDGRMVLTWNRAGTAQLWDAATGEPSGWPFQHQVTVYAAAFNPDGTLLGTASRDGTVQLWDVATAKRIGPPVKDSEPITALAFSPDGKTILTGGQYGRVRLWAVTPPTEESLDRILLEIELVTGLELDEHNEVRSLDAFAWQERRLRLAAPAGPYSAAAEQQVRPWRHRRGANEAEQLGLWREAVDHLTVLLELTPNDAALYLRRGIAAMEGGNYRRAAADYAKAMELGRQLPEIGYHHALLLLLAQNLDGYRRSCTDLLARYGNTGDPFEAMVVAWSCGLAPGAVADPLVPVRLAERAVKSLPQISLYLNTLGAAQYRAGQYEKAIERLNESIKVSREGGSWADWVFLAMAHYRLGHRDEARQWLRKVQQFDRARLALIPANRRGPSPGPRNHLEFDLLRREAEGVVNGTNPKAEH
jgi:tetratricopeptide (TPR) repeat protein